MFGLWALLKSFFVAARGQEVDWEDLPASMKGNVIRLGWTRGVCVESCFLLPQMGSIVTYRCLGRGGKNGDPFSGERWTMDFETVSASVLRQVITEGGRARIITHHGVPPDMDVRWLVASKLGWVPGTPMPDINITEAVLLLEGSRVSVVGLVLLHSEGKVVDEVGFELVVQPHEVIVRLERQPSLPPTGIEPVA